MHISYSLNKKNLNDLVIKSVLRNSIIEIFRKNKNFDILPFLVSIKINKKIILVRLKKPIIKFEILILQEDIKNLFQEKLKKMWFKYKDEFEIKYII